MIFLILETYYLGFYSINTVSNQFHFLYSKNVLNVISIFVTSDEVLLLKVIYNEKRLELKFEISVNLTIDNKLRV